MAYLHGWRVPVVDNPSRSEGVSFVLRLWLDSTEETPPAWRWKIHHVQTGAERYCRSLPDVLDFVGGLSKVAPPQVSTSESDT